MLKRYDDSRRSGLEEHPSARLHPGSLPVEAVEQRRPAMKTGLSADVECRVQMQA